jgi:hypothetical protein
MSHRCPLPARRPLSEAALNDAGHFPVMKSLTILPKTVIPRIMPMTIAKKTAKTRVNLKTTKKSGNNTMQSMIVRQPVVKSFDSSIGAVLPSSLSGVVYYKL